MRSLLLPRSTALLFVALLLPGCDLLGTDSSDPGNDADPVVSLVRDRLDEQPEGTGVVVGIVEGSDRRILSRGVLRAEGDSMDGRTLFEIGSITKTVTALALADGVERDRIRLFDRANTFLPDSVNHLERSGRSVTLEDLVTHTAGLPRLPPNLDEQHELEDPADPYAAFSISELHRALNLTALRHPPGTAYQYSNYGAGLLGHLLARRADTTYRALVRQRITAPLGMSDTRVEVPEEEASRFATGHQPSGDPASHWHFTESMAGAGALRSSARDMMTYLAAQLNSSDVPPPVRRAIDQSHTVLFERQNAGSVAYGWLVRKTDGYTVFGHTGGTGGFRSFAGFAPEPNVGIVVLSNVSQEIGETGLDLLEAVADAQSQNGSE